MYLNFYTVVEVGWSPPPQYLKATLTVELILYKICLTRNFSEDKRKITNIYILLKLFVHSPVFQGNQSLSAHRFCPIACSQHVCVAEREICNIDWLSSFMLEWIWWASRYMLWTSVNFQDKSLDAGNFLMWLIPFTR